jgi:hypothetical protein
MGSARALARKCCALAQHTSALGTRTIWRVARRSPLMSEGAYATQKQLNRSDLAAQPRALAKFQIGSRRHERYFPQS